jgi:glycine cleavage system regulatory protein
MNTTLRDKIKSLSTDRQEKIASLTKELIEEEMTLRDLRKRRNLTQAEIAPLLDIKIQVIERASELWKQF